MHRPAHPAQDAPPVARQPLGEAHQGLDAAFPGLCQPLFPRPPPRPACLCSPQRLQPGFHHVHRRQGLIGCQQLLQTDALPIVLQILRIAQQQPARLLDHPTGRAVIAQTVGLVHAHPVDHLPPVFGHHVKQVVDHPRLRAVRLHLQIESGIHVHGDCVDAGTARRPQPRKEWPDRLPAAPFAHPQHPPGIGIHDNRGVAMAFVERKFVHHQTTRLRLGQGVQLLRQAAPL
ncbi:hypothetical protein D3C72_1405340 [compost metagenome]